MLTETQQNAYEEQSYLKVENIFAPEERQELKSEMEWIVKESWGEHSIGFHEATMRQVGEKANTAYNKLMVSGLKKGGQEQRRTY